MTVTMVGVALAWLIISMHVEVRGGSPLKWWVGYTVLGVVLMLVKRLLEALVV